MALLVAAVDTTNLIWYQFDSCTRIYYKGYSPKILSKIFFYCQPKQWANPNKTPDHFKADEAYRQGAENKQSGLNSGL